MKAATTRTSDVVALDRILDPLARCLTPAAARALVTMRADPETQARIAELADKCNEGHLTREERREYEAFVRAIDTSCPYCSPRLASSSQSPAGADGRVAP